MEPSGGSTDIVHPEVRAHINSLVSALGGFSADDDGRYVLGDSALEVLRDIKKWIRFYDEKTNRMDVARCLAEANLVDGDLLHILAGWPEAAAENRHKARAALACLEVLVPLTWPLDRSKEEMTVNHHRHMPVLQLAQVNYKRSIINFDAAQILHTAVRAALPSMALPRNERSTRDAGIIKLVLLFLRNIAMIAPPPNVKYDGDESQVSRSALIDAFSFQDILLALLTLASNMGEDFNQEGVIVMEIIFHLVKRVDVDKLYMDDKQLGKAKANELTSLMSKEAAMHRPHNRKAPTRHNRWGTMIWVQRDDGKMSTVSGQDALLDAATRQEKMDNSKVYRPPRRARKEDMEPKDLGPLVSLNDRARQQLKSFVDDFLDSGFNPLFLNVRKKLDEEKEYVFDFHRRQFFYLVSWFLEAQRVRKKTQNPTQSSDRDDLGAFNLVANVLTQEMFITLNRSMSNAIESKNYPELCACMRCFTQILLTVQEMSGSGIEEDEEIAENILNRIFYEEETHERVVSISRNYKDQGFEYLDSCTELTHTYLRTLEAYTKQNVDLQVRSRRRTRRKRKAARMSGSNDENPADEDDDSENDQAKAERTTSERKFDFGRFANRFVPQGVVDTFVKFTKYYQDLNDDQLKRAHRYFYRVAFKQNMSVMLFRVDIIQLFYSMIKGREPLDKSSSMCKEWEELVKQLLKKCIRKIDERPALLIEMLFSKINATAHYLEYGYEKQTISKSAPKPGAELEFKNNVEHEQQVAIVVGALLDKNLAHHINWVKEQLSSAGSERRAWEAAETAKATETADQPVETTEQDGTEKECPVIAVRPDDEARRTAMFKNSHLRLLMKLVGFERLASLLDETPDSSWIVPPSLTSGQLQESVDLISKAEFDPPSFDEGRLAEDQLRRKSAPRKKAVFDDDDGDAIDDEELFPAGGPTARKVIDDEDKAKKPRRRRRRGSELPEEQMEAKARARRDREKEKARRFKSALYVNGDEDLTDEERDREFFAKEEELRRKQQATLKSKSTGLVTRIPNSPPKPATTKRKAQVLLSASDSESNDDDLLLSHQSSPRAEDEEDDAGASDTDNTPLSSSPQADSSSSGAKRRRLSTGSVPAAAASEVDVDVEMAEADAEVDADADADDDEDIPAAKQPRPTPTQRRRPRARAGFIIDSSDEE